MAYFEVDDGQLFLRLGRWEKIAALSSDVRVPLAQVTAVQVVDRAWRQVSGLRIGTGIPGLLVAGRFFGGAETFAVCHRRGPGVRVDLRGIGPTRLVATVEDPESVALMVRSAAGLTA